MIPLCINCKRFDPEGFNHRNGKCKIIKSPVDGQWEDTFAANQRSFGHLCGPEGKNFIPKDKEEPKSNTFIILVITILIAISFIIFGIIF